MERRAEVGVPRERMFTVRLTEAEKRAFKRAGIDLSSHVRSLARALLRDQKDPEFPVCRAKDQTRRGTIYFALASSARRVKIGFTSGDPGKRLAMLQVGSPERICIVASKPGTMAQETSLHERFFRQHAFGEWFDNDILEFIKSDCDVLDVVALASIEKGIAA